MAQKQYEVKRGRAHMDGEWVIRSLHGTYWAANRSRETILAAMDNSLCFGVFDCESGAQVAFARAITDYTTAYYLCDVVVDEHLRGQGIGSILLQAMKADDIIGSLRGILATRDAHDFYRHFGFIPGGELFMQTPPPFQL